MLIDHRDRLTTIGGPRGGCTDCTGAIWQTWTVDDIDKQGCRIDVWRVELKHIVGRRAPKRCALSHDWRLEDVDDLGEIRHREDVALPVEPFEGDRGSEG